MHITGPLVLIAEPHDESPALTAYRLTAEAGVPAIRVLRPVGLTAWRATLATSIERVA